LRAKFKQEEEAKGKKYILSAAIGCRKPDIEAGYEIAKLAE
jgi:hypothetical protein